MKDEQLSTLRKILRDLFEARYAGTNGNAYARAQGYADGFMASMIRSKLVTQRELLLLIGEERARIGGPSTSPLSIRPPAEVAA